MRSVLSLSLDNTTIKMVKKQTKRYGFDNVSQYLRKLIKDNDDLISEDELLRLGKEAEKEYREGKTIKANSLADLL